MEDAISELKQVLMESNSDEVDSYVEELDRDIERWEDNMNSSGEDDSYLMTKIALNQAVMAIIANAQNDIAHNT